MQLWCNTQAKSWFFLTKSFGKNVFRIKKRQKKGTLFCKSCRAASVSCTAELISAATWGAKEQKIDINSNVHHVKWWWWLQWGVGGGLTAGEQVHVESAGTNSSTNLHSAICNYTLLLWFESHLWWFVTHHTTMINRNLVWLTQHWSVGLKCTCCETDMDNFSASSSRFLQYRQNTLEGAHVKL